MTAKVLYYWKQDITIFVGVDDCNSLGEAMDKAELKFKEVGIKMPKQLGYVDWLDEDLGIGDMNE